MLCSNLLAPDCPPNVLSVQAVSSRSIRVTWSPLRDSKHCRLNGALRGYKVFYILNKHGSRVMYQYVRSKWTSATVVTGLDKYTEYRVQVLAYTTKDGPLSKVPCASTSANARKKENFSYLALVLALSLCQTFSRRNKISCACVCVASENKALMPAALQLTRIV